MSRGSSVVERMPEEHGVGSSILPRGTNYNPKTLRKFLNKVDGLAEGAGGGVGSLVGVS